MTILVIGSGGREHAIAWSLSKSPSNPRLFIAPGNGGTAALGKNVSLDVSDHFAILAFVLESDVDLVIIGPEQPLVEGLADYLRERDIPVVGPSALAARLEGSKAFSKAFMANYDIPTAAFRTFTSDQLQEALGFARSEGAPIVVKASGLAAGKGAIVCATLEEAEAALTDLMAHRTLGDAADQVVIESFMEGEEVSVFVFTDGNTYVQLAPAQDHKRIGEGDTGPNTGGMGAYAPAPIYSEVLDQRVQREIIEPTLEGMKQDGCPFQGILYVGLMITKEGPKVVEYNCRLGDPETQVILPLLESDAVELFEAVANETLHQVVVTNRSGFSACVVLASEGYPGAYEKGKVIAGLDQFEKANATADVTVFHAGTKISENGDTISNGGRVLAVNAVSDTLENALGKVYSGVSKLCFDGMQYRKDIGQKGLKWYK